MRIRTLAAAAALLASTAAHAQQTSSEREEVHRFVTTVATMSGAVFACDQAEARYIETCADLILEHWDKVNGPATFRWDDQFRAGIGQLWAAAQTQAAMVQQEGHGMECRAVLEEAARSPIWRVCGRDGRRPLAPLPSPRQPRREEPVPFQ